VRWLEDKLRSLLEAKFEARRIRREKELELYPPDIPNENGHHAFIKGIGLENSFGPLVGEYNLLFETQYEKVYVWTHTRDKYSSLISDIGISVKENAFWKTAGSLINLSLAYYNAFEGVDSDRKLEYKFIYYFSDREPFDNILFANVSEYDRHSIFNGIQLKLTEISNMAQLIELLNRDDNCFTAVSLLLSSFQIHYCCLTCELGLVSYKIHESHEPEFWEHADCITSMESGVVQACRCAESILGEPPNTKKQAKVFAHKKRWYDLIGIEPDELYKRAEMSYWEFYLKMFHELRNPSAHSYGNVHFDLERKHTIDVQCFAALVLRGYINENKVELEEALNILNFDRNLLGRVQENDSTKLTRE
jgi:hypothetical protein